MVQVYLNVHIYLTANSENYKKGYIRLVNVM